MKIESLKIKNFKVLRDVEIRDIPRFCVIIGANGSGKSTLFDVFGFLREAFASDVHTALIKQGGSKGFAQVRSRGAEGNIEIEIKFRAKQDEDNNPLITYFLSIGEDNGHAVVTSETLKYHCEESGRPWELLRFEGGDVYADAAADLEAVREEGESAKEKEQLKSTDILAIKGLAQFQKFPAVVALGNLIEKWHFSDIHISEARHEQEAGFAEHLSRNGENLSLVIDYLHQNHRRVLDTIIRNLKYRVPGISDVTAQTIETGQVLLKIKDEAFDEPFLARHVSDGTLMVLAYLVLLYDPNPHPLLCVEEPENQLYPSLWGRLAEDFRAYAEQGGQVFVSTHSPDFLNAVNIEEVFMLIKKDGYSTIASAINDEQVKAYMDDGDKMGLLWGEGWFEGVGP